MVQTGARLGQRWLFAVLLFGMMTVGSRAQAPKPPTASPVPAVNPALAAGAPATTASTPEVPDKVVLKVGDQQFTKADMDRLITNLPPQAQQAITTRGKRMLGDQYSVVVILAQQAHLHHLDQTPTFAQRLAVQRQQLEAQAAYEEINQQAKVSPEDVQQYYTAHAAEYDEATVRQIVIRKKAAETKPDPAHPAMKSPGLPPEEAKARAEAVRKELLAGTDANKIMAESAPGDVNIDAAPRPFRRGQGMRADVEKIAFALKDGEVSEPIDLPMAFLLVQVVGHGRAELKAVTPEIERTVRQQKVDAAMDAVKKSASVWMDDQYFTAPASPQPGPTLSPAPPGSVNQKLPPKP